MRLVFPTNENIGYLSKRGAHFGKAKFYTVITLDNEEIKDVEVLENKSLSSHSCGGAVKNILDLNPDALVVGGIGSKPAQGFYNAGLDVYFDKNSKTVENSVKLYLEGKLSKLENQGTCSSH